MQYTHHIWWWWWWGMASAIPIYSSVVVLNFVLILLPQQDEFFLFLFLRISFFACFNREFRDYTTYSVWWCAFMLSTSWVKFKWKIMLCSYREKLKTSLIYNLTRKECFYDSQNISRIRFNYVKIKFWSQTVNTRPDTKELSAKLALTAWIEVQLWTGSKFDLTQTSEHFFLLQGFCWDAQESVQKTSYVP